MKKKLFTCLTSVVVASSLLLVGCGSSETNNAESSTGGDKKVIKVANFFADDHPQNIALREKFKPMIEEGSNGSLEVQIYSNNQLGAEQEFYDGVRNGSIEMGISGMAMQSSIEKIAATEWPYLYEDYEHVKKVLNGPIGDELTEDLESLHGIKGLAWSANGFRMFSSNKTLSSIEDFNGLRLRMPNIPNYIDIGHRLGAIVSPLAMSEVFTGLEQKVIDGQENPIATLRASGWYEVQTDVLESYHMFSPNLYIINLNFWNGLTVEQQELVQEASTVAAAYEFDLMEKSYADDKAFLEEKGIIFTTPDPAFRQAMIDAVEPMYDEFSKQYDWAADLVERIRAEAN
ncbi:TRAP transporter substrate-binding protein [bacterium LRH843]|nr:TRAP transporter substrate-binding protein [bacterium LRH843]